MSFNGDLYPTTGATSVLTTKGDLVDYDTQRQRLGIGSANQILQVKSNLPSWETVPLADTVLTTQGDILYENASGLARLGFGTSGDVLTTKGTGANPTWETPASGGATVSTQSITPTTSQTTTSSPYVDVSNGSLTLANRSGGSAFISAMISAHASSVPANVGFGINYDSSLQTTQVLYLDHAGGEESMSVSAMDSLDGGVVKLQWRISSGTATLINSSLMSSRLFLYEVS